MSAALIPDEIITPKGERLFPVREADGVIVWRTREDIIGADAARQQQAYQQAYQQAMYDRQRAQANGLGGDDFRGTMDRGSMERIAALLAQLRMRGFR